MFVEDACLVVYLPLVVPALEFIVETALCDSAVFFFPSGRLEIIPRVSQDGNAVQGGVAKSYVLVGARGGGGNGPWRPPTDEDERRPARSADGTNRETYLEPN